MPHIDSTNKCCSSRKFKSHSLFSIAGWILIKIAQLKALCMIEIALIYVEIRRIVTLTKFHLCAKMSTVIASIESEICKIHFNFTSFTSNWPRKCRNVECMLASNTQCTATSVLKFWRITSQYPQRSRFPEGLYEIPKQIFPKSMTSSPTISLFRAFVLWNSANQSGK